MSPPRHVTFESADLDHIKTMILMHYLMNVIMSMRCEPSCGFEGGVREGRYRYSDEQESDFSVGWNADTVVALAYHKYCYEPEVETADPLQWLAEDVGTLPDGVAELGRKVAKDFWPGFTSGMLITSERRYRSGSRKNAENGLARIVALTDSHRSAFQRWNGPIGITDAQGALAWKLAERAWAGGGDLSPDEIETILEWGEEPDELFVVTAEKIATVTAMLGAVGLRVTFPDDLAEREADELETQRTDELAAFSADELSLFRAVVENDAATVKAAIARGARTDLRSVQRMLPELRINPGWSPLAVAFQHDALDAALALVESGASIAEESGDSALQHAVRAKSLPIVRACLERKPSPQMLAKPLLAAIQYASALRAAGAIAILGELVDAGAVVDDFVMRFARYCKDAETIAFLEGRLGKPRS